MKFRKERSEKGIFFMKRKASGKKKIVISTVIVFTIAATAGGVYWKYQSGKKLSVPEKTVQATKVTAEISSIANTIVGTGNLETDTPVSLKIPSGITISEVKVESGDHVSRGDVLAEVDVSSVYEAMEEVQEKIKVLDEQIAELKENTDDEVISASMDGRVKKIYISQGEDISSCMLENGALLVLSIDGKMAVDLTDSVSVPSEEDTVTVTLSSGTQVEGTVEKVSDDGCTITMTDSGVGLGDTATVTDGEGQEPSGNQDNNTGTAQNTENTRGGGSTSSGITGSVNTAGGSVSGTQNSDTLQSEDTEIQEDTSSQYSTDTTAFTISGDTSMLLSVSVDELDINSVTEGQKAQITFDAIEDKSFEGTVTKVGNTASASGGVAKYTVEITIPKDEKMKAGMNASATITIEEKENIITIPVNALQERGKEVFVYTEQDDEGNLSGEQQVTTGLSDGENVEITEGLSEGDVVYYQKTGGQNADSGQNMGMPDGNMGMTGNQDGQMNREPGGGSNGGNAMGGGMGAPPEK